jgi:tetratricopeptide (TPR) repeat protein
MVTRTWELSLDALERAGIWQARPLLWLLSCYAPGSRIPVEIVTALCPDGQGRQRARQTHPLHALLDPEGQQTPAELVSVCLAGLTALASFSLIQRRNSETGTPQIDLHPVIAEATRAVLANSDSRVGTATSQVRQSAVAAVGAAIRHLDVGQPDHWPRFHLLTSHVQELLATTARNLGRRQRGHLLDYMVSCITSYLWSRAEPRAEQLATDALTRARELGCATLPAYLRLRHVLGWALREQGQFREAAACLSQVLDEQRRLRGGVTRTDALHTRHDLAWTKGRLGHWDDAAAELRAVLEDYRAQRRRRGHSVDDAFTLHTRCKLYWCTGKQGRWDIAEPNYRRLLADRSSVLGAEHPDTLDTRESLGKALAWQARWDDAQAEFATLAAARGRTLGEQHPDTLLAYQLHAYAVGYQARQHHDDGALRATISRLEWIVREQEFVRGAEHQNTQDSRAFLAALRGAYRPDMRWTDDLPSLDV